MKSHLAPVLVIERDPGYGELLRLIVEKLGLEARVVASARQARASLERSLPRLLILGGREGLNLCLELKSDPVTRPIAVIVLGDARAGIDEFESYRFGADLFLRKTPATLGKLEGYVQAFLQRLPYRDELADRVTCGAVTIDGGRRTVEVRGRLHGNVPPKQFELLSLLAAHAGRPVSRETVLRELWSRPVRDRQVDVLVSRLKSLLGPDSAHLLESVRGKGYRLKLETA